MRVVSAGSHMYLSLSHIFLYTFGNVIFPRDVRRTMRGSKRNAQEGETYRVNCERSKITQTRSDQPYRTSATLMFRYGTFLRRERIYKRKRLLSPLFFLSLSFSVMNTAAV